MILVGFFCVLGAIGLLIAGLARADPDLVWASIGASAVGGLAVVAAAVQRGRALRTAERATDGAPDPIVSATAQRAPTAPTALTTSTAPTAPTAPSPERRPESADGAGDEGTEAGENWAVNEVLPDELPRDDVVHGDAVLDDDVVIVDDTDAEETAPADDADARDDSAPADAAEDSGDDFAPADETAPVVDSADAGGTADADSDDPVDEPAEEDVDMADLSTVIELTEEVLVVDLRPRYHLAPCEHLNGREAIPLPVNEAREDGFTPCSLCRPDAALAAAARQVRSSED